MIRFMALSDKFISYKDAAVLSISIVGLIITLSIFGANEVIAVDLRALDRYNKNKDMIIELLKENSAAHLQIISDLKEMRSVIIHTKKTDA